jgi:hypothetical protein
VELPGIEPATEIALTCESARFQYAKRRENKACRKSGSPGATCSVSAAFSVHDAKVRETTCGYAKGVDGVNTPQVSSRLLWVVADPVEHQPDRGLNGVCPVVGVEGGIEADHR